MILSFLCLVRSFTTPLLVICESLRRDADGILAKVKARERELDANYANFQFNDDACEFEEWLEEKRANVQRMQLNAEKPGSLEFIRGQMKRLDGVNAELAANEKVFFWVDKFPSKSSALIFLYLVHSFDFIQQIIN